MDTTGSVAAIESALDRLAKQRNDLEELWAARKLRLDLCLRLRLFERDALEVSSQLEMWSEELQHSELTGDIPKAEQFLRLHNESVSQMQNTTYQVLQQGQDLVQVFENSGICVMADAQYNAQTRVRDNSYFIFIKSRLLIGDSISLLIIFNPNHLNYHFTVECV